MKLEESSRITVVMRIMGIREQIQLQAEQCAEKPQSSAEGW
jgi:hypothetical protein